MGWVLHSIDRRQDPDGGIWQLDYGDPRVADVAKEILQEQVKRYIWKHYAAVHFAGIDELPDLTAYKTLKKRWMNGSAHRQLYFLETVVQGAARDFAEKTFHLNEEGLPACLLCSQVCTGCPLEHVAYHCSAIEGLEHEGIQASYHLVSQAKAELQANSMQAFWLRGLSPLPALPDPLDTDYLFHSSYDHMQVGGKVLGGDGSGGRLSKDFRTRQCGFGLVVLNVNGDPGSLHLKKSQFSVAGFASGSVPGKQSVPRAEATALLHALRTTSGNAVFICDNLGVVRRFTYCNTKSGQLIMDCCGI